MTFSQLEIRPIFNSLVRQKYNALLVILQIGVTMAVISNAAAIVFDRYQYLQRDSGLDEQNSFYFTSSGYSADFNPKTSITEDLNKLRALPGVIDAIQSNELPLLGSGDWEQLQRQPGDNQSHIVASPHRVDDHGLRALGVELLAGENFSENEVTWYESSGSSWPSSIIVTEALAQALYPELSPMQVVGKTVYVDKHTELVIKGVIDQLQAPWVEWPNVEYVFLSPARSNLNSARYLVRTQQGELERVMREVESMLPQYNDQRVIRKLSTIEWAKQQSYKNERATVVVLLAVVMILTVVMAMGIVGLASFNVSKSFRQIGIRRALGASRFSILRYYQIENLLLTTVGAVIGASASLALNIALVNWYGVASLNVFYVVVCMLAICVIGQLAVFVPATRASMVPPSTATRAV